MLFKLKKLFPAAAIFGAFTLSFGFHTPKAFAVYQSESDTGTTYFDYIENARREAKANALTDEQKKLLEDIETEKEHLKNPIDPEKPFPAIFEGDDMVYNAETGEFTATGKVYITQLDGHRFQSGDASGNIKTQDILIEGKSHMLQLSPNAPRVTLDGYHTVYNYGTQMGTMDAAAGKAGEYYITGKKFEFYPDHVVITDGTQTKCNAQVPDYRVSAKKIEIWNGNIMRMYNMKFWLKNKVVGTKMYEERELGKKQDTYLPSFGYNSDHGYYVEDTFGFPLTGRFTAVLNAHIETKEGVRSNGELHYHNREFFGNLHYGYYSDNDAHWIQKQPSPELIYQKHFHGLPMTYMLRTEIGRWKENRKVSLHKEYEAGLFHDPIWMGKYVLFLGTSYKITNDDPRGFYEYQGKSTVRGMNYDIILGREFDDRFAMYVGYHFKKNNSQNSMFVYNLDDYSQKFETGISYRLTPLDRFVVGCRINTENSKLEDTDVFWYHDLHCSQLILRWRAKSHNDRSRFEAHWQFLPW